MKTFAVAIVHRELTNYYIDADSEEQAIALAIVCWRGDPGTGTGTALAVACHPVILGNEYAEIEKAYVDEP